MYGRDKSMEHIGYWGKQGSLSEFVQQAIEIPMCSNINWMLKWETKQSHHWNGRHVPWLACVGLIMLSRTRKETIILLFIFLSLTSKHHKYNWSFSTYLRFSRGLNLYFQSYILQQHWRKKNLVAITLSPAESCDSICVWQEGSSKLRHWCMTRLELPVTILTTDSTDWGREGTSLGSNHWTKHWSCHCWPPSATSLDNSPILCPPIAHWLTSETLSTL